MKFNLEQLSNNFNEMCGQLANQYDEELVLGVDTVGEMTEQYGDTYVLSKIKESVLEIEHGDLSENVVPLYSLLMDVLKIVNYHSLVIQNDDVEELTDEEEDDGTEEIGMIDTDEEEIDPELLKGEILSLTRKNLMQVINDLEIEIDKKANKTKICNAMLESDYTLDEIYESISPYLDDEDQEDE